MPKAAEDHPKHAASLAAQLQNDRNPLVSESKRRKRKRRAREEDEAAEDSEQVISGKPGRQILTLAREQQEEEYRDDESKGREEMQWRISQMFGNLFSTRLIVERTEWKKIPSTEMKSTMNTMLRRLL